MKNKWVKKGKTLGQEWKQGGKYRQNVKVVKICSGCPASKVEEVEHPVG